MGYTELRRGSASVTSTGNHYDGGSSIGLFTFAAPSTFWVTGSGPDEPEAVWNSNWQRCNWVDHLAWFHAGPISAVYPTLPDKQIELNSNFVESSVERSVALGGGGEWDGVYLFLGTATGTSVTKGCRFVQSSSSAASAAGRGGVLFTPPAAGSLTPVMQFEDSDWAANVGSSGPAIYVSFVSRIVSEGLEAPDNRRGSCGQGQVALQIRRCAYRDNLGLVNGGAIFVLGSQALVLAITQSVFDSNAVRPPPDAGAVDVTVRLNTGGFRIDLATDLTAVEAFIPIWRIDDEPVHGISFELCERARQSSLTAVSKGGENGVGTGVTVGNGRRG
eukprot:COSAG04_NODE_5042_length_1767_cov_2.122302_2_plen_331_part_01